MKEKLRADEVDALVVRHCKMKGNQLRQLYDETIAFEGAKRGIGRFNNFSIYGAMEIYKDLSGENEDYINFSVKDNMKNKYVCFTSSEFEIVKKCFSYTPFCEVENLLKRYLDEYIPTRPRNSFCESAEKKS